MKKPNKTKHIFISHHGADDASVQRLKSRLRAQGYEVKNGSIDSLKHKDGRKPSIQVIERLLRLRIQWASKVVCLIGKETANRPWVDFELKQAREKGKDLCGVFDHGGQANEYPIPKELEAGADSIFGWNSVDRLGKELFKEKGTFENPDGTSRTSSYSLSPRPCC